MLVNEIMHKILTVEEDLELHRAIELMVEKERGSVIIMRGDSPLGIFTERDAVRLIIAKTNFEGLKVSDVMSKNMIIIDDKTSILDAARIMEENNIRRLPIKGEAGNLIGMVTAASIAKNKKYMIARSLASGLTGNSMYI